MEWSLLAPLDVVEQNRLLAAARRRSFAKGEVICHEGDPADSLHLVASGRVTVRVSNRGGDAATLNVLVPGDFFGELALLRHGDRRRRTATVTCLEPVQTLSLSAGAFYALCEQHPAVNQLLVVALAARVDELSSRLLEASYVSLDRRVIRTLLRLTGVYDEGSAQTMIPLTQHQLAELVGGTRPSVNQVLARLSAQDIISIKRGHLTLLDPASLRRKAGYDAQ